jgi:hypothetical protein
MSTPINQIRSRLSSGQQTQLPPTGGSPMMYDPTPPPPLHDLQQLGTTFPQQQQQHQMPPQMPSQDNNGMLEDILREMERSSVPDTLGPDPNVGLMNYAINPVNIPPPMSQHTKRQLEAEATHAAAPLMTVDEHMANINGNDPTITNNSTLLGELSGGVLGQKIINSVKPLVFVFLIVLVLSLHQTNRFLFSFFPQLLLENGQLSIYAILLRCSIAVILFYVLGLII